MDKADVLATLQRNHRGREAGVSAEALAEEIAGHVTPRSVRALREVIVQLRLEGHPVCGVPATGYYVSTRPEDVEETVEWLYRRALTTLTQISRMKNRAVPNLRKALGMDKQEELTLGVRRDYGD